jgi:hypothetical protein
VNNERIAIKYHTKLLELARLASLILHRGDLNSNTVKTIATKLLKEIKEDLNHVD